ncbi:hypothetical protein ACFWUQ_02700 [Streptomyces sp. NPDC058662]|uniref:hypothetical protein n=1 Tax=Streptomyces sp. NPDC058662 TaxID=3346583 RepID=UPI00364D08CC
MIGDGPLHETDIDLVGPRADWTAYLSVVRDTAVPPTESLAALLVEMTKQLNATAADAPRAVGELERVAARVGRAAAGAVRDDPMPAETVAPALGTTGSQALVLPLSAQDR